METIRSYFDYLDMMDHVVGSTLCVETLSSTVMEVSDGIYNVEIWFWDKPDKVTKSKHRICHRGSVGKSILDYLDRQPWAHKECEVLFCYSDTTYNKTNEGMIIMMTVRGDLS